MEQKQVTEEVVERLKDLGASAKVIDFAERQVSTRTGYSLLKVRSFQALVWVQTHLPIIAPAIDRVGHLFGFCIGH